MNASPKDARPDPNFQNETSALMRRIGNMMDAYIDKHPECKRPISRGLAKKVAEKIKEDTKAEELLKKGFVKERCKEFLTLSRNQCAHRGIVIFFSKHLWQRISHFAVSFEIKETDCGFRMICARNDKGHVIYNKLKTGDLRFAAIYHKTHWMWDCIPDHHTQTFNLCSEIEQTENALIFEVELVGSRKTRAVKNNKKNGRFESV